MENSAVDFSKKHVSKPDFFLLERWQENSPLSDEAQCEQIFTEYMKLSVREREPYDPKEKLGGNRASHLSPESRELLYRVRPHRLTFPLRADVWWLRTCYTPQHEEAWKNLHSEEISRVLEDYETFNDASLYNFGPNWQRVFLLWPELLASVYEVDAHEERIQEELEDVIKYDKCYEDKRGQPDFDSEGRPDVRSLCFCYHSVVVIGRIHIVDEITLSAEGPHAGKVLVVFYDECGRVVRYSREDADYAVDMTALSNCYLDDHPCWSYGQIGEEYQRGAKLGPPYTSTKDSGDGEVRQDSDE